MNTQEKVFDLLAIGQSQVDFYGQQINASLKDLLTFKKGIGGSALNVALGSARLGLHTALLTNVGKDPLGKFIIETLKQEKVATHFIKEVFLPTGIGFHSLQTQPIHPPLYYQQNCAYHSLQEEDVDPLLIAKCKAIFITTSFPNENIERLIRKAIIAARGNNTKIILALESHTFEENSKNPIDTILPLCDLIIGYESQTEAIQQRKKSTHACWVIKKPQGCFIIDSPSNHHSGFTKEREYDFNPIDAFHVGFIQSWLKNNSLQQSCEEAEASFALAVKHSHGALGFASKIELSTFLIEKCQIISQTPASSYSSHLHYASNRYLRQKQLYLLTLEEDVFWKKITNNYPDKEKIQQAKYLIAETLVQVANIYPQANILFESDTSFEALELFADNTYFVVRNVTCKEFPLCFYHDITQTLLTWPKHHVAKATIIYHPDDRFSLRAQQEETLNLLYTACRGTEHQLIIEIIPPVNSIITANTLSHIIDRFYKIGIYPDWWQVPTTRDLRSFGKSRHTIQNNDPYCYGSLITASLASPEQLGELFKAAITQGHCKGFVIGQKIYSHILKEWLAQKITNEQFQQQISTDFLKIIDLWETIQDDFSNKLKKAAVEEIWSAP